MESVTGDERGHGEEDCEQEMGHVASEAWRIMVRRLQALNQGDVDGPQHVQPSGTRQSSPRRPGFQLDSGVSSVHSRLLALWSSDPQVEYMVRIIKKWCNENNVKIS